MPPKKRVVEGYDNLAKKQRTGKLESFLSSTLSQVVALQSDVDGHELVGAFLKLPSKKLYPDYYQIVSEPICITDIQKKVAKGKYESSDEFVDDFKQLFDNANLYNDPDLWIVADAKVIFEFVQDKAEVFENGGGDELSNESLPELAVELLTKVIEREYPEIGVVSGPFLEVVDRKLYPDYFTVITNPTSFNKVISDIKKKKLFVSESLEENLDTLHAATTLIFTNAQTYNDPTSLIHQDSKVLQKYFEELFADLKARAPRETKKLTLSLKPKKEPVKVKLNLKPEKRGRKKEIKEENDEVPPAPVEALPEVESKTLPVSKLNTLGKATDHLPIEELFIHGISLSSTLTQVKLVIQQAQNATERLTPAQAARRALFPAHPSSTVASLFEYRFKPNGYSAQAYSLSLPPDATSHLALKVLLHSIIYEQKRHELVDGQTYLTLSQNDDFHFKLYVNNDEVTTGGDVFPERTSARESLAVQYDVKLTPGLNVVEFEMRIAPSLNKKIKKDKVEVNPEEMEGRHTRHQLQQLKMNWEVEKFSLYISYLGQ